MKDVRNKRFVLYPSYQQQRAEFAQALELVWRQSGWCVNIDELWYIDRNLKLGPFVERLLTQGRSKDITVVCGMQRPVQVTRFAISQATHVLCFFQEGRDLKTVTEATSPRLEKPISQLKSHEFVWYYRPTRQIWAGKAQDLGMRL